MKRCLRPIQTCLEICRSAEHEDCVKCTGRSSSAGDLRTGPVRKNKSHFRNNERSWSYLPKKIDGRRFLLVINKLVTFFHKNFLYKKFQIKEILTVEKFQKFVSWFQITTWHMIPLQNVKIFSWAYVSFLELSDQMTPKIITFMTSSKLPRAKWWSLKVLFWFPI